MQVIKPLQIKLMGFRIVRAAFDGRDDLRLDLRLRGQGCRQPRTKLLHDRLRELALHAEDILQVARVGVRPELFARGRAAEARGDAHCLTRLANASLDQMAHAELAADLLRRRVGALEGKGRCARRDLKGGDLLERAEQLLAYAVGEIFVLLVVAEVREGQDRDGVGSRRGRHSRSLDDRRFGKARWRLSPRRVIAPNCDQH